MRLVRTADKTGSAQYAFLHFAGVLTQ